MRRGLIDLAVSIAERSRENPDRPRLSEPIERRLHDIEKRSAMCYAGIEMMSAQFHELAARISGEDETDGVPQASSDQRDESGVFRNRIEDLRQKTST